jgi:hypothetical protein
MLILGDYTQSYGKLRRFGNRNNTVWREIFTQSESRKDFDCTKAVLKAYLDLFITGKEVSNTVIIEKYLKQHADNPNLPKDLLYYYIKYQSFTLWDNNPSDGFYSWEDRSLKPYECWMLFKRQFNGRHWNPFLLEISNQKEGCTLDNYGSHLVYSNGEVIFIVTLNNQGFSFTTASGELESAKKLEELKASGNLNKEGVLVVKQNDNGVDLEDRITLCLNFLGLFDKKLSNIQLDTQ